MDRVADSTIKGFLYQFSLTLKEILTSSIEEEIRVEGIIEDIDIIQSGQSTAIQCKYHEAIEVFNLSAIYKPILQMLKHYAECRRRNDKSSIKYILYAYFPSLPKGEKEITISDLETILNTTNIDYICSYVAHIKKTTDPIIIELVNKSVKSASEKATIKEYFISNTLEIAFDLKEFLEDSFKFIIGESFCDLEKEVCDLLVSEVNDFSDTDAREIFYPNAIQKIADISIKKNEDDRILNKQWLIQDLLRTKSTAITRWTKELTNYKELLKVKRKQLSYNLNNNQRKRCIIFNSQQLTDFEENIVMFIKDFTDVYCCKVKLHTPAIICIEDYNKENLDILISRLYAKSIKIENGFKGNTFFKDAFLQRPEFKLQSSWMQFVVKLCFGMSEIYEAINENKPDDLFVISEEIPAEIDLNDINVEHMEVKRFSDLKYLLKIENEVR